MSFLGQYEHSLDSKDRLTVPSRFRAALADGVVLSKGFDPCVWVQTTEAFEALSDRFLSPHSPFGRDARALRRRFHGGSFDETLDSVLSKNSPRRQPETPASVKVAIPAWQASAARIKGMATPAPDASPSRMFRSSSGSSLSSRRRSRWPDSAETCPARQ